MDYSKYFDAASAKERFMGNEEMFKHFLYQLPERNMYEDLEDKMGKNNVEEAFTAAHTLKGLVANLSLSGLEKAIHPVVEALRAGSLPADQDRQSLREEYEGAVAFIADVKEKDAPLFS